MTTKKIALAASTVLLAVSGAFASNLLAPELGHTNIVDQFPGQTMPCEEQVTCDNTNAFPCELRLDGVDYPLYRFDGEVCVQQLTHSTPFIPAL